MIGKGQKRKLQEDDAVGDRWSWERQRQSVLDISLEKYQHGQELLEPSLRRSVLITNTLHQIQLEIKPPVGSSSMAAPVLPTAPPHRDPPPAKTGVANCLPGVASEGTEDDWVSSETDFCLSTAISSILKELDMAIDGGTGPHAPQRTVFRSIENLPGDLSLKHADRQAEGCRGAVAAEVVALGSVEVMRSSYLQDVALDDLFQDIDTSVIEREMGTPGVRALSAASSDELLKYLPSLAFHPPAAPPPISLSQHLRDLNELEHIMEILVES